MSGASAEHEPGWRSPSRPDCREIAERPSRPIRGDDPFCNPIGEVNPFSGLLDVRL